MKIVSMIRMSSGLRSTQRSRQLINQTLLVESPLQSAFVSHRSLRPGTSQALLALNTTCCPDTAHQNSVRPKTRPIAPGAPYLGAVHASPNLFNPRPIQLLSRHRADCARSRRQQMRAQTQRWRRLKLEIVWVERALLFRRILG